MTKFAIHKSSVGVYLLALTGFITAGASTGLGIAEAIGFIGTRRRTNHLPASQTRTISGGRPE